MVKTKRASRKKTRNATRKIGFGVWLPSGRGFQPRRRRRIPEKKMGVMGMTDQEREELERSALNSELSALMGKSLTLRRLRPVSRKRTLEMSAKRRANLEARWAAAAAAAAAGEPPASGAAGAANEEEEGWGGNK